jgi:hypothetical protein
MISSKKYVKTSKPNLDSFVLFSVHDIGGNESLFTGTSMIKTNEGENQFLITLLFTNRLNLTGLLVESSGDKSLKPSSVQVFAKRIKFKEIGVINNNPLENFNLVNNNGKVLNLKPNNFKNLESLTVSNSFKISFYSITKTVNNFKLIK